MKPRQVMNHALSAATCKEHRQENLNESDVFSLGVLNGSIIADAHFRR